MLNKIVRYMVTLIAISYSNSLSAMSQDEITRFLSTGQSQHKKQDVFYSQTSSKTELRKVSNNNLIKTFDFGQNLFTWQGNQYNLTKGVLQIKGDSNSQFDLLQEAAHKLSLDIEMLRNLLQYGFLNPKNNMIQNSIKKVFDIMVENLTIDADSAKTVIAQILTKHNGNIGEIFINICNDVANNLFNETKDYTTNKRDIFPITSQVCDSLLHFLHNKYGAPTLMTFEEYKKEYSPFITEEVMSPAIINCINIIHRLLYMKKAQNGLYSEQHANSLTDSLNNEVKTILSSQQTANEINMFLNSLVLYVNRFLLENINKEALDLMLQYSVIYNNTIEQVLTNKIIPIEYELPIHEQNIFTTLFFNERAHPDSLGKLKTQIINKLKSFPLTSKKELNIFKNFIKKLQSQYSQFVTRAMKYVYPHNQLFKLVWDIHNLRSVPQNLSLHLFDDDFFKNEAGKNAPEILNWFMSSCIYDASWKNNKIYVAPHYFCLNNLIDHVVARVHISDSAEKSQYSSFFTTKAHIPYISARADVVVRDILYDILSEYSYLIYDVSDDKTSLSLMFQLNTPTKNIKSMSARNPQSNNYLPTNYAMIVVKFNELGFSYIASMYPILNLSNPPQISPKKIKFQPTLSNLIEDKYTKKMKITALELDPSGKSVNSNMFTDASTLQEQKNKICHLLCHFLISGIPQQTNNGVDYESLNIHEINEISVQTLSGLGVHIKFN